ncbi:MAG: asparagine synthase (glutamine-hydrolyzing) [Bacteroidetes bacterium]|nr:asparagine synthase (glutamine-hydrolyzing) [Bacteroidota bacterium]
MCGITGAIGLDNCPIDRLLKLIEHRGPDSNGWFEEDGIFLGHTRLAIQDLSENGNQPFFSNDGRYVIIFNGEIYNHLEIRKNLENEFLFRSTCDTETLLYAYIKYGVEALNKLNGIFAFAIYDIENKEIFLARDQFGIKPFYFYQDEEKFLFSSELKSFTAFDIDKTISSRAIADYLTFLWSPGASTPFAKVKKLLPGHYFKCRLVDLSKAKPVRYYTIPFNGKYSEKTEQELIDELENMLLMAVDRQMLADVPVGFFLSGGMDSSLLVAMARKLYPHRELPCFTIDTDELAKAEGFASDLPYAKKVAGYLNVDLTVVPAGPNIIANFDAMVWHLDEPQADLAPLNIINICREARDNGILVLIGGTAGDDLFSGYRRHLALNVERHIGKFPKPLRKLLMRSFSLLPADKPLFRRIRKGMADLDQTTAYRMAGYFRWLPYDRVKKLFAKKFHAKLDSYEPLDKIISLTKDIPQEKNLLNQMLYFEMMTFLVDHNLNYTDKLSMAAPVEVRVPFLDIDLVAFSATIPPSLKMKGKETKYILRKVAERYLPRDVIYRSKTGFGTPVRKWITNDLESMIADRLSPQKLVERGIFDPEEVWQLIEENKAGKIDASYAILSLLVINSWMDQFADKK